LAVVGLEVRSEYANDGTFSGTWAGRAGYFPPITLTNEYSTYFDGINDVASFGDAFLYDRSNQFSMSFWLKPDNLASQRCFYSKTTADAGVNGINLQVTTAGRIAIQARASGAGPIYTGTTQALAAGAWGHVVVTYTGSSDLSGFRVYVNGVVDSIPGASALSGTWLLNQTAYLGARGGSAFYWVGGIDEVSVWNKALSAAEALETYNGGSPLDLSEHSAVVNLKHWYRMGDSDTYPTLADNAGAVNGTLQNTTIAAFQGDTP
jgi:hypothetical protein